MRKVVVDTNVAIVAAGRAPGAPATCQLEAVRAIHGITSKGGLILDELGRIYDEYRSYFSYSGQPTVGDEFFRWVHDNRWNDRLCTRVTLTPEAADPEDYVEFPKVPELMYFDRADRKFAAAALVAGAPVVEAVDTDWWEARHALASNGVEVEFICESHIERLSESRST